MAITAPTPAAEALGLTILEHLLHANAKDSSCFVPFNRASKLHCLHSRGQEMASTTALRRRYHKTGKSTAQVEDMGQNSEQGLLQQRDMLIFNLGTLGNLWGVQFASNLMIGLIHDQIYPQPWL